MQQWNEKALPFSSVHLKICEITSQAAPPQQYIRGSAQKPQEEPDKVMRNLWSLPSTKPDWTFPRDETTSKGTWQINISSLVRSFWKGKGRDKQQQQEKNKSRWTYAICIHWSLRTSYLNVQLLFYYSGQQQLQDMYVQKYFHFCYYVSQQLHSDYLCLSIPDLQCIVTIVTSWMQMKALIVQGSIMHSCTFKLLTYGFYGINTYTLPCTLIIQPHNLLFSFPPI